MPARALLKLLDLAPELVQVLEPVLGEGGVAVDPAELLVYAHGWPGDAGAETERGLPPLEATVVKVPHHGSLTSSTAEFVRAAAVRQVLHARRERHHVMGEAGGARGGERLHSTISSAPRR